MEDFIAGRYETGNISSEIPVVRRMNSTISSVSWYNVYPRMKNISTNENIQTSMIWGSLFDETLEWIIETGDKARVEVSTDSTSWGNYSNSTFKYYNSNGALTQTRNYGSGSSYRLPTGSTERNSANNVYDLCGNVCDWTLEVDGSYNRYLRGGYSNGYGTSYPAQYRVSSSPYSSGSIGFRAYFYIK